MKVVISKSTNPKKKYMAVFTDNGKKVKTTHFGQAGALDFIKSGGDEERKKRYLDRHKKEDWNKYMTAGSLSRYISWNKPTLRASIADYKRRFNLS